MVKDSEFFINPEIEIKKIDINIKRFIIYIICLLK